MLVITLMLLVIFPFIPAIIHITMQNKQSFISKFIDTHFKGFFEIREVSKEQLIFIGDDDINEYCPWLQWRAFTETYHMPFFIQFMIQTLPQFAIQVILLSYNYNNIDHINILSIAISIGILSFMLKIIPFCGYSLSSFSIIYIFFDYCCIVTDMLLLFIMISSLCISSLIYQIFYFKFIYVITVLYIWSWSGIIHDLIKDGWSELMDQGNWRKIGILLWSIFLSSVLILFCFPYFLIFVEMACFSLIWIFSVVTFRARFIFENGQNKGCILWNQFNCFVNKSISKRDKILRLCTINHILIENNDKIREQIRNLFDTDTDDDNDDMINNIDRYLTYFTEEKYDNLYENVTMKTFVNTSIFGKCCNIYYYIWNEIYLRAMHYYEAIRRVSWTHYNWNRSSSMIINCFVYLKWCIIHNREVIYWKLFCYILGIYYLLSRFLNIFLVFYVVYLSISGANKSFSMLFEYVFMRIILIIFVLAFCGIMIFGIMYINRCYYIEWNILPGFDAGRYFDLKDIDNKEIMHKIHRDYYELIDIPIREQIIKDKFGANVGGVVIRFIGRFAYDKK